MNRFLCVCLVLACATSARDAVAETILFESGTLGPTGVPSEDVTNQVVFGANINPAVFNGVRFEVLVPVQTTRVGGHFVSTFDGESTLFGAIVRLDDQSDFPDSGNLSTDDVLGTTLLEFPEPSSEVFGDLNLLLEPGWYALVFGSGLFDTSGDGAALLNNSDIGMPEYIAYQRGSGWTQPINPIFRNYRFVVEGTIIPEPTSAVFVLAAIVLCLAYRETR